MTIRNSSSCSKCSTLARR